MRLSSRIPVRYVSEMELGSVGREKERLTSEQQAGVVDDKVQVSKFPANLIDVSDGNDGDQKT